MTRSEPRLRTGVTIGNMMGELRVAGMAEQCRARIAEVCGQGIDRAIVYPFGPYDGGGAALAGFGRTIEACAGA